MDGQDLLEHRHDELCRYVTILEGDLIVEQEQSISFARAVLAALIAREIARDPSAAKDIDDAVMGGIKSYEARVGHPTQRGDAFRDYLGDLHSVIERLLSASATDVLPPDQSREAPHE